MNYLILTNLSLGVNRRLRRPWSRFLNPFPSRSSQTNIFLGNIDLDPTFTTSYELGYLKNWKKVTLSSSLYYSNSTGKIEFVSEQRGETPAGIPIIYRSPINLSTEDRFGLEITSNYNPYKWWRITADFNMYESKTVGSYEDIDFGQENFRWYAKTSMRFSLPKEYNVQTSAYLSSPRKSAQTDQKGYFSMNFSASKDITNKLSAVINVSDIFNSSRRRQTSFTPSTITYSDSQYSQRQISLNLTYRFNAIQKSSKEDEERGSGKGRGRGRGKKRK